MLKASHKCETPTQTPDTQYMCTNLFEYDLAANAPYPNKSNTHGTASHGFHSVLGALNSFQGLLTIHSQLTFAITRQLIEKDVKPNHEATEGYIGSMAGN